MTDIPHLFFKTTCLIVLVPGSFYVKLNMNKTIYLSITSMSQRWQKAHVSPETRPMKETA